MNVDMARSERMAAIGHMSSTISHQILQKIGLLGLQCDLLRDTLDEAQPPTNEMLDEASHRVEQLDVAITDLNTTLSDLLVFSRDFALHREPGLLSKLLQEAGQEIHEAARARGVTLRYELAIPGEGPLMPFDHIKLKQAVLNLLTNALDASSEDGQITIGARQVQDQMQVTIRDTGTGIPQGVDQQMFAPFVSTKKTGSGLGLAFTQKIIELHDGTISARNNREGGATLTFSLPLTVPEQKG